MQSVIQNTKLNMNVVRFELIKLPYPTLARFGLTQEMIEDLPMRVLDEICDGRHSPVLPVRVRDEKGELIESRSRFALVRRDDGLSDVVFYPVLESSPLERYDEAQQKQLLAGRRTTQQGIRADRRGNEAGDVYPHADYRAQPASAGRHNAPRYNGGKQYAERRTADTGRGR